MPDERRLKDLVEFGTLDDLRLALESYGNRLLAVCSWIVSNRERDNAGLALYNLLSGVVPFVQIARQHLLGHIQILAFCARNVFEINLRTRHVLQSAANLQQWMAECVADNIEVLEGILQLRDTASPGDIAILETEIERLRSVARRHGITDSAKLLAVPDLAKAVGQEVEYRALFKLYSKLVHPSSYLLNRSADEVRESVIRQILVIRLQLYGYDLLERIRERLKVPEDVVGSHEMGRPGSDA
ncbi:MAG: hypothetical protein HYX75_20715 [Acidobacteria bacterium]|nr:hypothetical protein [Acidobacteriota bacterium]